MHPEAEYLTTELHPKSPVRHLAKASPEVIVIMHIEIPALKRVMQEDGEFKDSLDYILSNTQDHTYTLKS